MLAIFLSFLKTSNFLCLTLDGLKEANKANEYDIKSLENTREAVRKALKVEPDPTAKTLVERIAELKLKK